MSANYRSIVPAVGLLFALSASTSAAPGDLDPAFGSGGIVISRGSGPNHLNTVGGMAIQPDGKIVVVGDGTLGHNWDFAVVRYSPDGSLDSSFGGTGIVITQLDTILYEGASSVAIQADGKIVVAGTRWIVRYNPNGSLDTSFNGTGIVTPGTGVKSVAVQSDGKIIAAGSSHDGSTFGFALTRYNANGSLDTSFNGTGQAITPGGGVTSVAIQPDGRIIAAGGSRFYPNADFMLVRYNADGTPDTSFNGTGIVITPVGHSGGSASDLAIQTDGKIVAAGYGLAAPDDWRTADFALVRYNPDGSLDTSFGGTGKLLIPASDSSDYASSVAIQPNGKIVVAGDTSSNPFIGSDLVVVRLNPNGSLDTSFHGTGKVITSVDSDYDHASSVAIQADGKIVVAGDSGDAGNVNTDFVLIRYQGDDATPAACPNPIDCAETLVRQHYLDFLGREPDHAGLAFWTNEITSCGGDTGCVEVKRVHVSAAFFLSIEFQQTGFYATRVQRAAFGRKSGDSSRMTRAAFLPDAQALGQNVIVGVGDWQGQLDANKQAYAQNVVAGAAFAARFPESQTAAEYVAALYASAGVTPTQAETDEGVAAFGAGGTAGRAGALRKVAESATVTREEFNPAFVLMEYFGYLRRDPDQPGYDFWLAKLNQFGGNYVQAEMVKAFLSSIEYRRRFGQS